MQRRFVCAILAAASALAADPYAALRESMVRRHIEERGIRNRAVIAAMRSVPRHLFVPEEIRDAAYNDHPLPIGHGQTISQPYIVAYMTELLDPQPPHKVLEIGTGSGYQAAVLAALVKDVYTVEIVPELARRSSALLKKLGYAKVHVREADGYQGWPEEAPFDRIILTAAPPSLPQALVGQLKPGGRLVAPVGATPFTQELLVIDKGQDGKIKRRRDLPVRFVPMVPK